ncbi:hypothetical protein NP493_487g00028 [Ridgeia piscesae]|uniref:C2H2-type domain-containing protein n=1 Tax=Ridgeia piscesae TaxID=27915 RepID=A0AAD9NU43_RIDPI|nr:hypothetical protein NP493_487g00028 [Ridgeia piscesae]
MDSARSRSVPARRRRHLLAPPRSCSLPDPERRWRHSAPVKGRPGPPTAHSCCHKPPAFTQPPNQISSNSGQSESATNNNNPQQSGLGSSLKRTSSRRACYGRDRKQRKCSKKQYQSGPCRESNTANLRYKCVPVVPKQYSSTECESGSSLPGCSGTADQQRSQGGPVDDMTSKQRYQPPTFTYCRHLSGLRPECVQQMTPNIGSPDWEPAMYRRYNDARKSSVNVFNGVQSSSGSSVEPSPTRSSQTSLTMRRRTPTQEGRRTRDEGYVAGAAEGVPSSAQSHPAPQVTRSSSSQCSSSRSLNSVLTQSVKSIHWPPGVSDSSKAKIKKYKSTETQWFDVVDAGGRTACENCPGSGPFNKTARQYTCIKCGSVFKSRRHYYRHMLDFHLNDAAH